MGSKKGNFLYKSIDALKWKINGWVDKMNMMNYFEWMLKMSIIIKQAVFRICISFHGDPDPGSQKYPDPGSQKCPYGSGPKEEPKPKRKIIKNLN